MIEINHGIQAIMAIQAGKRKIAGMLGHELQVLLFMAGLTGNFIENEFTTGMARFTGNWNGGIIDLMVE